MPTYISLINYTQQGVKHIEDSPDRIDDARALAESMGGEFDWYLTFGEYDAVVIADFPDDETYAQFVLKAMSLGNVSGETLKAFTEPEFRELIEGL